MNLQLKKLVLNESCPNSREKLEKLLKVKGNIFTLSVFQCAFAVLIVSSFNKITVILQIFTSYEC